MELDNLLVFHPHIECYGIQCFYKTFLETVILDAGPDPMGLLTLRSFSHPGMLSKQTEFTLLRNKTLSSHGPPPHFPGGGEINVNGHNGFKHLPGIKLGKA